jgi:hypothetical protein
MAREQQDVLRAYSSFSCDWPRGEDLKPSSRGLSGASPVVSLEAKTPFVLGSGSELREDADVKSDVNKKGRMSISGKHHNLRPHIAKKEKGRTTVLSWSDSVSVEEFQVNESGDSDTPQKKPMRVSAKKHHGRPSVKRQIRDHGSKSETGGVLDVVAANLGELDIEAGTDLQHEGDTGVAEACHVRFESSSIPKANGHRLASGELEYGATSGYKTDVVRLEANQAEPRSSNNTKPHSSRLSIKHKPRGSRAKIDPVLAIDYDQASASASSKLPQETRAERIRLREEIDKQLAEMYGSYESPLVDKHAEGNGADREAASSSSSVGGSKASATRIGLANELFKVLDKKIIGRLKKKQLFTFVRHHGFIGELEDFQQGYEKLCSFAGCTALQGLDAPAFQRVLNSEDSEFYVDDFTLKQMVAKMDGKTTPEKATNLSQERTGISQERVALLREANHARLLEREKRLKAVIGHREAVGTIRHSASDEKEKSPPQEKELSPLNDNDQKKSKVGTATRRLFRSMTTKGRQSKNAVVK